MARGVGIGASLASIGAGQQQEAMQMLGKVADEETDRSIKNQQLEQQEKSGNIQLGATTGAMAGSYFGPWGTLVGGAIGAIAGGMS